MTNATASTDTPAAVAIGTWGARTRARRNASSAVLRAMGVPSTVSRIGIPHSGQFASTASVRRLYAHPRHGRSTWMLDKSTMAL